MRPSLSLMPINSLHLENIRCFAQRQGGRIGRITLLTGENSSGKSTFLAAMSLLSKFLRPDSLNFNSEPFLLGSFGDIIATSDKNPSSSKGFAIETSGHLAYFPFSEAFSQDDTNLIGPIDSGHLAFILLANFKDSDGEPRLDSLEMKFGETTVHIGLRSSEISITISHRRERIGLEFPAQYSLGLNLLIHVFPSLDLGLMKPTILSQQRTDVSSIDVTFNQRSLAALGDAMAQLELSLRQRPLHAYAPFRSVPKRTYDPLQVRPDPEGRYVPMKLARLQRSDRSRWKLLRHQIELFGNASGLFERIKVRGKFTKHAGDPFQLMVDVKGSTVNIIDAGYGVSQVLPIVVDALAESDNGIFLLQQPEVHLHPSAQAALGSFVWDRVQASRQSFLIETHSDHLADRIRMEIRDRKIDPSMLSFLYFENTPEGASIREIEVSQNGELVDPPSSYRDFFLTEELRLLGF